MDLVQRVARCDERGEADAAGLEQADVERNVEDRIESAEEAGRQLLRVPVELAGGKFNVLDVVEAADDDQRAAEVDAADGEFDGGIVDGGLAEQDFGRAAWSSFRTAPTTSSESPSTNAVAPDTNAVVSLAGLVSTAITCAAPATTLPWIAAAPTPPTPNTTTSSPGRTRPTRIAAPRPVVPPQDRRHAVDRSTSSSTFTHAAASQTVYWLKHPSREAVPTGPLVSEKR